MKTVEIEGSPTCTELISLLLEKYSSLLNTEGSLSTEFQLVMLSHEGSFIIFVEYNHFRLIGIVSWNLHIQFTIELGLVRTTVNSRYNQVGYNEMEIFPQSTKCINYYPLITNIRI